MCRSKKNLIGSISDTFCRTTTLSSKFFECTCAVIGFRVYQRFWTPEKRQLLNRFHESRNVFDPFDIKVCERIMKNRSDICLGRHQGSSNSSLNGELPWMSS